MKPYYENGNIKLYNADCRDSFFENISFDILLTDPPYGMAFQSNHRTVKHSSIIGDDSFDVDFIMSLVSRSKRASYVFCRWDNLPQLPKPKSVLAWVKNNWSMGDLAHEHGRQWEACAFYASPLHEFYKRIPDVIQANRTGNNLHPTEKPVELIQTIMSANVGEIVFDPFSGGGATLVAAKNLGRSAIGIEIEEKYCEVIAERLMQECLFNTGTQGQERQHSTQQTLCGFGAQEAPTPKSRKTATSHS
jgi:site-specific DNA-methyltransferase (adenine-specific)